MTTKNFFILHIPSPVHGATMMGNISLKNKPSTKYLTVVISNRLYLIPSGKGIAIFNNK